MDVQGKRVVHKREEERTRSHVTSNDGRSVKVALRYHEAGVA